MKEPEADREAQTKTESSESSPPDPKPSGATVHSLAQDRPKRVGVGPPKRYGFEDMVGYALQVAEEVDTHDPFTYKKAISGTDAEK